MMTMIHEHATTPNPAISGQLAAEQQSYLPWIAFGIFGWLLAPLLAYLMTPPIPASVLAQGPTDSAGIQVFMTAYTARAKSLRVKRAWTGTGLGTLLFFLLVGRMMMSVMSPPSGDAFSQGSPPQHSLAPAATAPNTTPDRPPVDEEPRDDLPSADAMVTAERVAALVDESVATSEQAFRIREAAAQGIGDEWEKRWALDRVTMDRFTFDQALEQLRGELAHGESTGDLSYAYSNAQFRLRTSQEALAAAQAQQPQ